MTMEILQMTAFILILCMLVQLLRQEQPTWAFLLVLAGICCLSFWALERLSLFFSRLSLLTAALDEEGTTEVLKCVGIAVSAQLTRALCQDAGQAALAQMAELIGRLLVLLAALPLLRAVLSEVLQLLQ